MSVKYWKNYENTASEHKKFRRKKKGISASKHSKLRKKNKKKKKIGSNHENLKKNLSLSKSQEFL